MKKSYILLTALVLLIFTASASASDLNDTEVNEIYVESDDSISDAVSSVDSSNENIIYLGSGTFNKTGDVNIEISSSKNTNVKEAKVTFKGNNTIIDGSSTNTFLTLNDVKSTLIFKDITFTNFYSSGSYKGSVFTLKATSSANSSTIEFKNCSFKDFKSDTYGAICARGNYLTINITDSYFTGAGGAFYSINSINIYVINSTFEKITKNIGSGLAIYAASPKIGIFKKNKFLNMKATYSIANDAALYASGQYVNVTDNIFQNCTISNSDYAIVYYSSSKKTGVWSNNTFIDSNNSDGYHMKLGNYVSGIRFSMNPTSITITNIASKYKLYFEAVDDLNNRALLYGAVEFIFKNENTKYKFKTTGFGYQPIVTASLPANTDPDNGIYNGTVELLIYDEIFTVPVTVNINRNPQDIYVSPSGSNSNAGTEASPLKTISAGLSKGFESSTNVNIHLLEGTYSTNQMTISTLGEVTFTGHGNVVVNADSKYFLKITSNTKVNVKNITFINAKGGSEGAFIDAQAPLVVENCIFKNYTSTGQYGALYIHAARAGLDIKNSTFINGVGGAIYALSTTGINIENCTFENIKNSGKGSAVFTWTSGSVIKNNKFINISSTAADPHDAGIYSSANTLTVTGNVFINSSIASTDYGVVYFDQTASWSNNTFINSSNTRGDAVYFAAKTSGLKAYFNVSGYDVDSITVLSGLSIPIKLVDDLNNSVCLNTVYKAGVSISPKVETSLENGILTFTKIPESGKYTMTVSITNVANTFTVPLMIDTSKNPYIVYLTDESLQSAIDDAVAEAYEIYIYLNGTEYSENITVSADRKITIIGNNSLINGSVSSSCDLTLENLTFNGNISNAETLTMENVTFEGEIANNGDIEITDSELINPKITNGTVSIADSEILNSTFRDLENLTVLNSILTNTNVTNTSSLTVSDCLINKMETENVSDTDVNSNYWSSNNPDISADTWVVIESEDGVLKMTLNTGDEYTSDKYSVSYVSLLNDTIIGVINISNTLYRLNITDDDIVPDYSQVISADEIKQIETADKTVSADNLTCDYTDSIKFTVNYTDWWANALKETLVEIKINNLTFNAVSDENGSAVFVLSLKAGNYTVNITNPETGENILSSIKINKIPSNLEVSDITYTYCDEYSFNVTFSGAEAITSENAITNNNTVTLKNLNAGNHTINITTLPDENHTSITKTVKITVEKAESTITADDVTFTYGDVYTFKVTYTGAEAIISDDAEINNNTVTLKNLNAGNYTVNLTTVPDANHISTTKSVKVTVNKAQSTITANDVTFTYGEAYTFNVSFTGAETITSQDAEINNNTVTLKNLNAGTYTVNLTTITDTNHISTTKTVKVTVKKAKSGIEITSISENSDYLNPFVVCYSISNYTSAYYTLNTASNESIPQNGNITLKSLKPATYTLTIFNSENTNYLASNYTIRFNISKIQTEISVSSIAGAYKSIGDLSITLKDEYGNPISAGITLNIAGKNYSLKSDVKGEAKFSLKSLTVKKYTVKVTYTGDDIYLESSDTATVTVNKAPVKITAKSKAKKKKYTVTLKAKSGAKISKAKLVLKIKGKKYKAKTNKKGKAVFKLKKLSKGKYKGKITFKGNANYKKAKKKVKIKVK